MALWWTGGRESKMAAAEEEEEGEREAGVLEGGRRAPREMEGAVEGGRRREILCTVVHLDKMPNSAELEDEVLVDERSPSLWAGEGEGWRDVGMGEWGVDMEMEGTTCG